MKLLLNKHTWESHLSFATVKKLRDISKKAFFNMANMAKASTISRREVVYGILKKVLKMLTLTALTYTVCWYI